MTPEVEQRFERIEAVLASVALRLDDIALSQTKTEAIVAETAASQAKTEAIANSNARAIQALGNKVSDIGDKLNALGDKVDALGDKLSRLIQIVGDFAQSTNTRLAIAENRIDTLENQ